MNETAISQISRDRPGGCRLPAVTDGTEDIEGVDVAAVAALLAEPARAAILTALIDGRALPATELAYRACVTPQTASGHLAKLLEGGLLAVEVCGRHRYYRLAGADVAGAVEALAALAPPPMRAAGRPDARRESLRRARTCYDHLAGQLGVALTQGLLDAGILQVSSNGKEFGLGEAGRERLAAWGVDVDAVYREKRQFARRCLDWTERRHHLAGALGTTILLHLVRRGWIVRQHGSRAVLLTDKGRTGLRQEFGVRV